MVLKIDVDTDMYATGIGEQAIAQALAEKGTPTGDDVIVCESPNKTKLSFSRCNNSPDAQDLVPVSKRDCGEYVVAHAMGQGMDKLM